MNTLKQMKKPFEEEHFKDISLLVSYLDYFSDSVIIFTENDDKYYFIELYCKSSTCNCSNVHLDILKNKEYIGQIIFDYKSREVESSEFNDLFTLEELASYSELFATKHQHVKASYQQALNLKILNLLPRDSLATSHKRTKSNKSVSRNAPCPCGSGKKYKRCCMKK